jgi:hypothetical protein
MKLADTDWKRAVWTGLVLLGTATSIIFGLRPGGFEGQIGWFLGLLPGVLVDLFFPHPFLKSSPRIAAFVFWALALGFTLMWYAGASFALIKAGRLLVRAVTSRTD